MSPLPQRAEVVVIGGGVAGVSSAWFLAKAGVPVVLCEKGGIAGEQSSRNWGWIRKQGRDPRELPASILALRLWEQIAGEIGEDIGWHKGGVTYLAETAAELARFEAWLPHARDHQLDSRLLSPARPMRCSARAAAASQVLCSQPAMPAPSPRAPCRRWHARPSAPAPPSWRAARSARSSARPARYAPC